MARLIFEDREYTITNRVTTLGRTSDNHLCFQEDSNVSRFHAEIELRFGDYWLIDLNSSNGTTLNGQNVSGEILLNEGDEILLGGSGAISFSFKDADDVPEATEKDSPTESIDAETPIESKAEESAPEEPTKSSKLPMLFGLAGLTVGLAIVCIVGVVLFAPQCSISTSACEAKATIIKPELGDTIAKAIEIELEIENEDCAATAKFSIDGNEFAVSEESPFTVKLDPASFATLSDGFDHELTVALFDEDGKEISKSSEVAIVFETQEIEPINPVEPPEGAEVVQKRTSEQKPGGSDVSVIDTKQMTETLLKQFSGNAVYKFDPQFLKDVQQKTKEFTSEGFFERASAYKDVINESFVKEQNLDPALGYSLAMSRTQFKVTTDAAGEGLWRMPNEFVTTNGYNLGCVDNSSLSDPAQICAAKASALYLKGLVIGVFEGDVIYSVAAFGKSQQAATIWKSGLQGEKIDFWNVIKTPREREQIVNFFAAAVVAQNPQKFGLKNDRPISELYGFMMQK